MKKLNKMLAVALSGLVMTSLVACGSSNSTASAPSAAEAKTEAKTETKAEESKTPAASDAVVLRVNMPESADSNKSKAVEEVKKAIEEGTAGRVTVEIHNNGELGTFADDVEAISTGSNLVEGTSPSAYSEYGSPDMTGLDLMMVLRSYDDCDKINESEVFKSLCGPLESESSIKVLAVNWGNMPRCVLSNKEINNVNDLNGKIIRVPLAPYVSFFSRLGCTTQNMSLADTYTALSQGTIDACEFGYDTLYNNSLYEVAKYCYVTEHTYAPSMWCMNSDIFNSLSEEDQNTVMTAFYEGGKTYEKMNKENQAEYKQKLEEEGVTFVEPTAEDKEVLIKAASDSASDFDLSDGLMDKIDEALGR